MPRSKPLAKVRLPHNDSRNMTTMTSSREALTTRTLPHMTLSDASNPLTAPIPQTEDDGLTPAARAVKRFAVEGTAIGPLRFTLPTQPCLIMLDLARSHRRSRLARPPSCPCPARTRISGHLPLRHRPIVRVLTTRYHGSTIGFQHSENNNEDGGCYG
jgi:hypothetical protein